MTYFGAVKLPNVLCAGSLGDAQPRYQIAIGYGPAGVLVLVLVWQACLDKQWSVCVQPPENQTQKFTIAICI